MPIGVYIRTAETRKALSKAMEQRHQATNYLCAICKSLRHTTEEHAQNVGKALQGKKLSASHKAKISANSKLMWQNPESRAKLLSEKRFTAISEGNKRRWQDPEYREKQRVSSTIVSLKNSESMKEFWSNPINREQRIRSILLGSTRRPTSYEQSIIEVIQAHSLPLRYTGDGTAVINGIIPDFIADDLFGVVEIFYSFWKIKNHGSVENYIEKRIKKLPNYSWLFLNEEDIAEGTIANKVVEFIEQLKFQKEHSAQDLCFVAS